MLISKHDEKDEKAIGSADSSQRNLHAACGVDKGEDNAARFRREKRFAEEINGKHGEHGKHGRHKAHAKGVHAEHCNTCR